jgi:hypothetical protein
VSAQRAALPRGFAEELRRENPSLAAEIVREIRRQIPEYDRPLDSLFSSGLMLGVETALAEFADAVAGTAVPAQQRARVYRGLGRSELAEGRSMDALQSACRLGGRLAWRRYARVARRVGMGPEQMVDLAEAVFTHVDQIAAASVLGYAQARADIGEAHERRRRLLAAVLAGADRERLEAAAEEADWALPDVVACVALGPGPGWREARDPQPHPAGFAALAARSATSGARAPGSADGARQPAAQPPAPPAVPQRLPEEVLADLSSPHPCLLLPEPEAWLDKPEILEFLRLRRAVVGPSVALGSAGDSLRWARLARERLPASALDQAPVRCEGRLPALLLLGDEALVRLIGERRLAPLRGLTVKQRERLESTLLAWLDTNRGTAPEVAARLGIHPQTARGRLHRLQELLGAALANPESRFELEVALRGRRMLAEFSRAA